MHILIDIPPGGPANAIACAILKAQGDRLDRLGRIAARELERTNRARDILEARIGALIDRLDRIDAATFDMEPSFNFVVPGYLDECEPDDEGDPLDGGEGDGDCDRERTAPERFGKGFEACSGDDEEPSLGAKEVGTLSMGIHDQTHWAVWRDDDAELEDHGGCGPDGNLAS